MKKILMLREKLKPASSMPRHSFLQPVKELRTFLPLPIDRRAHCFTQSLCGIWLCPFYAK